MAQSLFIRLQQLYPQAKIDVLAPGWSMPIVARMAEVNRGIEMPLGHGVLGINIRKKLGRKLRSEQYDQAIILPRSWKSAIVPWSANIPVRTGYLGESRYGLINDRRALDKTLRYRTVDRYVALSLPRAEQHGAAECPSPELQIDSQRQEQLLKTLELDDVNDRPAIAFMPGAEYGPAKRWPAEYFSQLAEQLVDKGFQVWVLGSPKETELGEKIANNTQHVFNLCGRTQLVDTVDLLVAARFAVGNDSGLMHIAAASGCEVMVLYGSSDPLYTPPLTARGHSLYLDLDCMPCGERVCPLQEAARHHACMKNLSPAMVLAALDNHL